MHGINLIAKHLNRDNLKLKVYEVETVCSFTGHPIREGVKNSDLIKKTFTDFEYIRYQSGYSSVDAALCIESVIPGKTRMNALRNYSYLATERELIFLDRSEILPVLLFPPAGPYVLCCTYSNKKHTAYKAVVCYDQLTVTTDIGSVQVDYDVVAAVLPIMQRWYTVLPGKEGTSQEQTYFTKKEIETGSAGANKIRQYGTQFFTENAALDQYRNTGLFRLLVHVLNKSYETTDQPR